MSDHKLAIPSLMEIDSRREYGLNSPPMRRDFDLVGVMNLQHPRSDADALGVIGNLSYAKSDLFLSDDPITLLTN